MERVKFVKKEITMFFIVKNDKSVINVAVVHRRFVRGLKQF